ncbi:SGNH/GDSL hydrolase family protein [Maribacter sp. PR1]|uniref:SGNH/GDSL hydrolase family protein n=1 Tax=Maribacter cobaltidurans TaxID=1178778 RepID=A0ABU7IZT3_9FLAO|nr:MULTISPECIES: SGNH/GDSL hydrolase family protein [Maribacter]MDC6391113.1 SGNH/GDSL hydrolase family protein [Maribacter sp. PR1]MEE1978505.1 SGNH/GDSL hydrolase family protein [Maribacter cobaltidurans]
MKMQITDMNPFKIIVLIVLFLNCTTNDNDTILNQPEEKNQEEKKDFSYLALGDSYTIGESVISQNSFPVQLSKRLESELDIDVETRIIAKTGWRTDDLKNAITNTRIDIPQDLVTLLIGVNNQYQNKPFEQYEKEFPELLQTALGFVNGNTEEVLVISIPDYAFTPFGQTRDVDKISTEIDQYNEFAKSIADKYNITFVEITDITRLGLEQPQLVANDGLHPSGEAYGKFVDLILPFVLEGFKD